MAQPRLRGLRGASASALLRARVRDARGARARPSPRPRPSTTTTPGRRGILAMGASAGLIPCPSALVVLLGAIAQHQVALGLLLIVAFSAGLAATLTALGVLVVKRGAGCRLPGPARGARCPRVSALAIVGVGVVLTAQAVPIVAGDPIVRTVRRACSTAPARERRTSPRRPMSVPATAPTVDAADAAAALRGDPRRGLRLTAVAAPRRRGALRRRPARHRRGDRLRDVRPAARCDLASVYRNLETLEDAGLVRHMHLGHGPGLYAPAARERRVRRLRALRALAAPCPPTALAGGPRRRARRRRLRGVASPTPRSTGLCPACQEKRDVRS